MTDVSERLSRSERFRVAIAAFIEERREAKLKGKTDADEAVAQKYEYGAWLADAARRVSQIQAVTHALKATHPDARGSSLYVKPEELPARTEVGTHLLGDDFAEDVVGNAAALDVYKFLKIEVDGRSLLDWMQADDADLRRALHHDPKVADSWMAAFGGLVRDEAKAVSHELAKQVYWLVGDDPSDDGAYHLLQPMFSSSLAHAVHAEIQDARFGEQNKEAREAYRGRKPHNSGYREYRNLVARKLGGTKPQNISQLNSERGGVNYLLASLPPTWTRSRSLNLLRYETVFQVFLRYEGVRQQVRALAKLLKDHAEAVSTMAIRQARERIEQDLGASLAAFGLEQQRRYSPGWTRDSACRLPECECLWLDPGRAELPPRPDHKERDEAFRLAYTWGDWADEVAGRFANWLNAQLREADLTTVGDSEARHWARQAIIDVARPVPMQRRAGGPA